jgi:hypothetical protein
LYCIIEQGCRAGLKLPGYQVMTNRVHGWCIEHRSDLVFLGLMFAGNQH